MRLLSPRLIVFAGFLALACATATEDSPLSDDGNSGGSTADGGSVNTTAGMTSTTAGTTNSSAGTTNETGGKGGTGPSAFGGTSTTAGESTGGTANAGSASGGTASGGTSSGGKAGSASGGSASGGKGGTGNGGSSAGTSSGGKGGSASGGNGGGGSGSGGSSSTTCAGVADWSSQVYKVGDTVAHTCSGVFASPCPTGQSHKFECNPPAGPQAVAWCQQREPGVGNGWAEAWIDKGQCTK